MLSMDVPLRSSLAWPVVELGDRELLGLDEHGGATLRWPVGDGVSFLASCTANDDLGARLGSRNLDVEDAGRLVSGDEQRVRQAGGNERPCIAAENCARRPRAEASSSPSRTRNASATGRSPSMGTLVPGSARISSARNCSRSTSTEIQPSDRQLRRVALPFGVQLPRRRVAARGARRAGGGARVRGARAHRPRRRLRLARVRARGEGLRRAADHRRGDHARRRRARHAARRDRDAGTANLCRLLTTAHAGTRRPGREDREPLPPSVSLEAVMEANAGLVCLSGCSRRGLGLLDPNAASRLAGAFGPEQVLRRAPAPVRARGHAPARPPARPRRSTSAWRPSRPATSTRTTRGARSCRTSSSRSAAGPRSRAASPSGAATARATSARPRRCSSASPSTAPPRSGARRSPSGSSSTSPRSSATATRTSRTAKSLRSSSLRRSAEHAMNERYCRAAASACCFRLEDELALIDELGLAGFFLLHHEVLELARECAREVRGTDSPRSFLPPGRGRGSSVGSIVCYLTGLSHVDPVSNELSLGRFLNRELSSVPDIDLDFPRDIREKLIVRVTERYGREHAALVASFATYRSRGAIRDVGKALGLPFAELERLARTSDGWNAKRVGEEVARLPDGERKLQSKRWRAFAWLTGEIAGLPRHVSQHPGGMIVSTRPLIELVPVQPAAMAGRQLCQWDKDSCSDAGFLKIDLLGLGMLSAVEDCVDQIATHARRGRRPLADPLRRRGGLRRHPARGHDRHVPDREPRADAKPPADEAGRTSTTSPSRSRSCGRGRSRGRRCIRTSTRGRSCARTRRTSSRSTTSSCASRCARRSASSSSRTRCSRSRSRSPDSRVGEAEGLRRAMSRKRSHDALEAYRERFVAGAIRQGRRRGDRRHASSTSSSASPASASRRRTRPRSGCSRTSRPGCATTTRRSSCARS